MGNQRKWKSTWTELQPLRGDTAMGIDPPAHIPTCLKILYTSRYTLYNDSKLNVR